MLQLKPIESLNGSFKVVLSHQGLSLRRKEIAWHSVEIAASEFNIVTFNVLRLISCIGRV